MKLCIFWLQPKSFFLEKLLIFFPKNSIFKKILIFSQKKAVLMFEKKETLKNLFIFQEVTYKA